MTRRTTARVVWLILGGLCIATGLNVALRERPFVSILIAAIAVGGMCAPLLTFATAAAVVTRDYPDARAELEAIRKGLPR